MHVDEQWDMAIEETTFDGDGSYEIRADERTNTLYLSFSGALEEQQMKVAADETLAAAGELDSGFAIINDISTFRPPSPEAAKPIQDAQQQLKTMDVGDVVRVVGDDTSAVVQNAFQRRSRKAGYEGKTAATVQAAERQLGQ
ncbi:hypothetical protein [Halapricum salinum]|uniref:Uncharacterized protein n=1 Tax=Halapricum salinum TaxID=1457250 RepID=A0A4D6HFG2_9EURY|nr:hypothetical protein [Halapricum salinum]QCC51898.1 hypothetical protein DV733_11950 [Halapricum salinum]